MDSVPGFDVVKFENDEEEYLRWLSAHPDGVRRKLR